MIVADAEASVLMKEFRQCRRGNGNVGDPALDAVLIEPRAAELGGCHSAHEAVRTMMHKHASLDRCRR